MVNVSDIAITSLETITAFDIVTGSFKFMLDELQNATLGQTEDKVDITGKQGRKLTSLKRNKMATISGTNGLVSAGLLELQTGSTFDAQAVTTVKWSDPMLTVMSDAVVTSYTAVGTLGNEIEAVYVKDANGIVSKTLTQGAAVAEGVFTYTPATKTIAFNPGELIDGTQVVVYYSRKITADATLKNMSDKYSEKCALYIDALGEDKCANIYRIQIYFPKADFNGEFTFEMGEDQAVHAFEAEALAGACGTTGSELWTWTVFGANVGDTP